MTINAPTSPADVAATRKQLTTQRESRTDGQLYEAVKANANVKDERTKFF